MPRHRNRKSSGLDLPQRLLGRLVLLFCRNDFMEKRFEFHHQCSEGWSSPYRTLGLGFGNNFCLAVRTLLARGCTVSQRFSDPYLARPLFDRAGRVSPRSSRGHHLERGICLDFRNHVWVDLQSARAF
jgi:hypothetical protein